MRHHTKTVLRVTGATKKIIKGPIKITQRTRVQVQVQMSNNFSALIAMIRNERGNLRSSLMALNPRRSASLLCREIRSSWLIIAQAIAMRYK